MRRWLRRGAHRSARCPEPAVDEGVFEDVDPIGEDAVHPGVDQPLHLDPVVDGPHVDVLARAMHGVDQAAGQDLQPAAEDPAVDRQLQDRGRRVEHRGQPGHEPIHGDAGRTGGAGDAGAEQSAESVQAADAEGTHADPVVRVVLSDRRGQQIDRGRRLGVDVEPGVGERPPAAPASVGMPSRPPIRARRIVSYDVRPIGPRASVTRSSRASWNATSTPSEVACTSVSR